MLSWVVIMIKFAKNYCTRCCIACQSIAHFCMSMHCIYITWWDNVLPPHYIIITALLLRLYMCCPAMRESCLHQRNQCLTGQSMPGCCSSQAVDSLCFVIERLRSDLGVSRGLCPSFLLRRADNEADTPINGQIGAWMLSQNRACKQW